jgi:uncharacterized protein (TIGR02391 family)
MTTLRDFFKEPAELLRLEPEELGSIIIEALHGEEFRGRFTWQALVQQLYRVQGDYWTGNQRAVILAIFEAVNWLTSQGLVMRDPEQSGEWYVMTRRGAELKTRADVEAYRKGGILPVQLLQPELAEKVHHLFVRGDHDTAVFQAFKTLEVAVRKAGGYDNTLLGKRLMTTAFKTDDGPLRNQTATQDEREAEMALFVGAIGHCKNPASHRDVDLDREEAARLIVFASHLLAIVEERAELPGG